MYTISDIVKKHKTNKAVNNYRFGQEHDEREEVPSEGKDQHMYDEELDLGQKEENSQSSHTDGNRSSNVDYRGLDTDILMDIIRQKDAEIERLHSVIQGLNGNLEKALELNNNNQILLLNKQIESGEKNQADETGFWGRVFRKDK